MRIYDPRIGRFLSVDPLTKDFPWYTPYQFAGNAPIKFIDLDGKEPEPAEAPGGNMRPILGGLTTPMPMASYARYGVSSAGFAYEENPLSTHEQIKQEEAFRREEYIRNSLLIGGKWVPRLEDEVRDLRVKASIEKVSKYYASLKAPLSSIPSLGSPLVTPTRRNSFNTGGTESIMNDRGYVSVDLSKKRLEGAFVSATGFNVIFDAKFSVNNGVLSVSEIGIYIDHEEYFDSVKARGKVGTSDYFKLQTNLVKMIEDAGYKPGNMTYYRRPPADSQDEQKGEEVTRPLKK